MDSNQVCGFVMDNTTCFKCGKSYGYNGYKMPPPCPHCAKKVEESKRICEKVKRKSKPIRRGNND